MFMLPSSSHCPPKERFHPPKHEKSSSKGRFDTAWDALVWAYRTENVRAANGHLQLPSAPRCALAIEGRGSINGYLDCHPDAIAIEALVKRVAGPHAATIADWAERGVMPPEELDIPPPRPEPLFNCDDRKPYVVMHPRTRRDWYCPVEWVGVMPETAEVMRNKQIQLWRALKSVLEEMKHPFWEKPE